MNFREQSLGGLLDARAAAATMLQEVDLKTRSLHIEEAIVMQGTAVLLTEQDRFYGRELSQMVGTRPGTLYPTLRRFEDGYGVLVSSGEDQAERLQDNRTGAYRRYYQATEFGSHIFALFQRS